MDEQWKPIGDTGYAVSNTGKVASMKRSGWVVLRQNRHRDGYSLATMCINRKHKTRLAHILVAELFLGPKPTPAHEVNHRDGDKANNRVDNLEWVTPSQNTRHRFDVLGHVGHRGAKNPRAKLSVDDVGAIRSRLAAGEFQRVIAKDYGVDRKTISHVKSGRNWAWLG